MASVDRPAGSVARQEREHSLPVAAGADLPSPEEVFIAWLLWLPDDADLAAAAAQEIARIDCRAPLSPELIRLRGLLTAAIHDSTALPVEKSQPSLARGD